jgi:hypothetical protein
MKAGIPIGVPPGTRIWKLERNKATEIELGKYRTTSKHDGFWLIWIHTRDYIHGTFLKLYDNGAIENVTVRAGEGDEVILVKGED